MNFFKFYCKCGLDLEDNAVGWAWKQCVLGLHSLQGGLE